MYEISEVFASPTFLSRLYEDLESNPSMREQRSSEVFWRPHLVPGDPSSRSPRGAPPPDRGPPAPEDPLNRSNLGETLSREATSRRLLETNFDETPQHTRSASYSSIGLQVTAENGKLIKWQSLWRWGWCRGWYWQSPGHKWATSCGKFELFLSIGRSSIHILLGKYCDLWGYHTLMIHLTSHLF